LLLLFEFASGKPLVEKEMDVLPGTWGLLAQKNRKETQPCEETGKALMRFQLVSKREQRGDRAAP
jgi:hypothetical protein